MSNYRSNIVDVEVIYQTEAEFIAHHAPGQKRTGP